MKNSNLYCKIYEIVNQVPYGMVTTYGAIALKIGSNRSARLVGYALNADKGNINAPYHRIVNRNGELTGSRNFVGDNAMRKLLEAEGIRFIDNKVDMSKHFWKP